MRDKSLNWLVMVLGALILLGVLAASTVLFRTADQAHLLRGPYALDVAQDQSLYVLTGREVIRLDDQGDLLGRYDLSASGLRGTFSDLGVLGDGQVVLADPAQRSLIKCDAQLGSCAPWSLKDNNGQAYALPSAYTEPFRLAVDTAGSRVFLLAPSAGHVVVVSGAGTYLGTLGEGLSGAQDVAWDVEGRLLVADTPRERVVVFNVDASLNATVATEIPTVGELNRLKRTFPIAVARAPDGRYWVAVADKRHHSSDVIVFDANRSPYTRVVLDTQARPRALVPTVSAMAIADPDDVRVLSVSYLGEFLDDYASPSLWSLFAELADAKKANDQQRLYAWMGLVGVLMFLPVWFFVRWSSRVSSIQTPNLPGARWFAPSALYRRRVRMGLMGYVVLLIAGMVFIISWLGGNPLAVELLLAFALIFALPVLAFTYFLTVLASTRIGLVDGQVIFIDHRGRIARGDPGAVVFNGTTAILDDVAVSIRGGGIGHVYGGADFDGSVLALIQKSAKGFSWAIEWRLLRLGHPSALVTYLVTLPVGIAALVLSLSS